MHRMMERVIRLLALAGLAASLAAVAAIPQTIGVQGYLSSGATPYSGSVQMTFKLYTVASGGAALWSETLSVPVSSGVYNVTIGATPPGFGLDRKSVV